jgi:segregation and condensation protein A
MDLLLQLIERAELDITKLALAQVTDQYLTHIRKMQERDLEEVSAFLVIAAKLLQIKSEALLPRPPTREAGEEDPGEELARHLMAYKRYREISELLATREASGFRTHLRLAPPPRIDGSLDLSGITLIDLVRAAQIFYGRETSLPELRTIVAAPRVTIREKISLIGRWLQRERKTTFSTLLSTGQTRLDIVVTFLAMLELVKRYLVNIRQERLFGEIELEKSEAWNSNAEFETEFGE